jgi:rubrerythrin
MNARLFISTFILIFLAELGDKTQLAALARAAGGEGGKWTVFLAASSALVLSTLIAVSIGAGVKRLGFAENAIRIAAGVMFVVLGLLLVLQGVRPKAAVPSAAGAELGPRPLLRLVLNAAQQFEEAAAADYLALAAASDRPGTAKLLSLLAAEEAQHLARLRQLSTEEADVCFAGPAVPPAALQHELASAEVPDAEMLEQALAHERITADFYGALAHSAPLPALRSVFQLLQQEELEHADQVEELIHSSATQG